MALRSVRWITTALPFALLFNVNVLAQQGDYRGKPLGKLSQLHHGVSGEVFAVDARTLHIRNFNYDGEGPAAYFYVGSSKTPGNAGFRIRDERGTTNVLPRYRNQDITVTLPEGKTLQNIRWFSVWCDEFAVNFGDVKIPKGFDFPRPFKLGTLGGIHGVSSDPVVIVDAQTLLIPNFSYDGEAPDAKFWVGQGAKPSPQGIKIPDENGKIDPLRRYDRKTIVLTLPNDMTVFDIGHFGVWCEAFAVDFGHVQLPQGLNVPPSLKMLGVSPQSKLNCEVLYDDLAYEVRWAVAGDSIVLQLVARLEGGEYMSFGISGHESKSQMVGGDVTVAWVDKETLKGQAKDYYLDAKSQCSGTRGSCPDERLVDKSNSVRLLNAALVNGYSIVTYQRSLKAQDEYDRPIITNGSQPVIWAIGPLNQRQEVSYHSIANRADILLDFGRPPKWNCPTPESPDAAPVRQRPTAAVAVPLDTKQQNVITRPKATPAPALKVKPWDIPAIQCNEPDDGVFYAQMGPTGGKHGYPAITGHVGWGISWYINGLLIPVINVVRGRTYTFITEGGINPEVPARYHPFYITDDPVGGYEHKTPEERAQVTIFAGAVQNKKGEVRPTGVGRLCNWTPDQNGPQADEFASFGAYQRTLRLLCDAGEPGIVQWTVAADTPDTVYYQCYSHRYLGWKINVLDSCDDDDGAASDPQPMYLPAPGVQHKVLQTEVMEPEAQPSVRHVSRVKPDSGLNQLPAEKKPQKPETPFTYVPVPQFHFYNEETGEPLDDETLQRMNPDIQKLKSQFLENIPSPSPLTQGQLPPPHSHVLVNFNNDEQFLDFFHTPRPTFVHAPPQAAPTAAQVVPTYSVQENQEEPPAQPSQQVQFNPQNEIPVLHGSQEAIALHPYTIPHNHKHAALPAHQFQHSSQHQVQLFQGSPVSENPSFATSPARPFPFETSTVVDEKFHKEFLKNYHQLQAEAAAKLKKHNHPKSQQQNGKTRVQYSAPRRPQSQSHHHALTLQQRPVPPGMFRPPFYPPPKKNQQKRPSPAASQNVPTYANANNIPNRPNNYIVPHKPQRQTSKAPLPTTPAMTLHHHAAHANMQQVLALQKLLSTITPQDPHPHTTPYFKGQFSTPSTPLKAVNTGFNPSSVKVEGGFKPILNTGIAPAFKIAQDRMDDLVDEADITDDIGVIDLTKSQDTQQSASTNIEREENEEERHVAQNKNDEREDIFKHLKPVMFEPMFVPSPPDYRAQKNPPKHRKKPINAKYQGSIKNRNNYLEPYNAEKNKYVKMRPRPTLIRRPLYPDEVVPPFKIPLRGGPQFRYHESDESVEETTDFEIIPMSAENNDSSQNDTAEIMETERKNTTEPQNIEIMILNTEDGVAFDNEFQVRNSSAEEEVAMADERRDVYLPPDAPTSLTYDGRRVAAVPPPPPEISRTFDIRTQPQFAPYSGELPDLSASVGDLPQLVSTAARSDILPPGHSRRKRSPHHEPGHEGHDHDGHEGHVHHETNRAKWTTPTWLVFTNLLTMYWFL